MIVCEGRWSCAGEWAEREAESWAMIYCCRGGGRGMLVEDASGVPDMSVARRRIEAEMSQSSGVLCPGAMLDVLGV